MRGVITKASKMVENFRGGEVYSIMLHAGGKKAAECFYTER
jgi:hypothetical protein